MLFKKIAMILSVAALCGAFLPSCQNKPKIDLSGLQGLSEAGNGQGAEQAGFVEPGADGNDGGAGILLPGEGDGGANGGVQEGQTESGSWGKLGEAPADAVSGAAAGGLKNAHRWNACIIYFSYNQSELTAGERGKLTSLVEYLNQNPKMGVLIEGHTDDRGSDKYNRALAERRALAVQQYLTLLSIAPERIRTISYGEDRPVVPNAQTESDHQRNRRAEFVLGEL